MSLTAKCGNIWYREVKDQESLIQIRTEINTYLNPKIYFLPSNAFVVTYDQVCDTAGSISIFQIIITSDDSDQHYFISNIALASTPGSSGFGYIHPINGSFIGLFFSDPVASSNVNSSGKWIYSTNPDYTPSIFKIFFILF